VFVTVERAGEHRISGLLFRPAPDLAIEPPSTWADLTVLADSVASDASWQAAEVIDGQCIPVVSSAPDVLLPIGSTFKLYVLDALVDAIATGALGWDDSIVLTDAARSLPSGTLHAEADGTRWTIDELAARMIANSDNTATDMLIDVVGRDAVEAAVVRAGHSHPDRMRPFLRTREMFALKAHSAGDLRASWVAADLDARRSMLTTLPSPALDEVLPWLGPRANYEVEWFASTMDLCGVMTALHERTATDAGARVADLLSANPGVTVDESVWPWVGYKGGSEPGVLNLTWLLRRTDDRMFFFSMTFADPDVAFDELTGIAIAAHGLALLETIP
jgi:beta-lactamase class A